MHDHTAPLAGPARHCVAGWRDNSQRELPPRSESHRNGHPGWRIAANLTKEQTPWPQLDQGADTLASVVPASAPNARRFIHARKATWIALLPVGEKVTEGRMRGWTHCQNGLLIRNVLAEFVELRFTTHGSGLGDVALRW